MSNNYLQFSTFVKVSNKIYNMIRKERLKKHLSQKELADRCNLSQSYISKIEKGERVNVTIKEIIKLSKALGLKEIEVAKYFLDKYKNTRFEIGELL